MKNVHNIVALLSGIVFALGLGISGMTRPEKVIGFLDIFGAWDPALLFVISGAIFTYAIIYRYTWRRRTTLLGGQLHIPTSRELTPRLFAGAALFGVGWGLSGFCPGPALASSVSGNAVVLVFLATMGVGMLLYRAYEVALERRHAARVEHVVAERPVVEAPVAPSLPSAA